MKLIKILIILSVFHIGCGYSSDSKLSIKLDNNKVTNETDSYSKAARQQRMTDLLAKLQYDENKSSKNFCYYSKNIKQTPIHEDGYK